MYRFASPCCELPKDWKGKDVYFHVGSATSNLTLWVNGKYVGYSEDGKADVIVALCDKDGKQIASATGTQGVIKVPKVKAWTAETSYLYKVRVCHKSMAHPLLCYLLYNPRSIVAYSKKGII